MPKHRVLCLKGQKPHRYGRPPLCVVEPDDEFADAKLALARQQSFAEYAGRGESHPGFDTYRQEINDDAAPGVEPTLTLEGEPVAKKSKSQEA